jgi:hypothetical protein
MQFQPIGCPDGYHGAPLRAGLPPLPAGLARMPTDHCGYPVPWFVAWYEGKPEFRATSPYRFRQAIAEKLCWVCGLPLRKRMTFVAGPMCGINRTSAEPPSHFDCAMFSAIACPFLSMPKALRREANLPDQRKPAPGIALARNPGVTMLWMTKSFVAFKTPDGGQLVEMGPSIHLYWIAEGRAAVRAEVMASITSGMPSLQAIADAESQEASDALSTAHYDFISLIDRRWAARQGIESRSPSTQESDNGTAQE